MERLIDIIFSTTSLIVFSPILIFVSIILSLTGEREIFFFQYRVGKNKKKFKIFKFATMLKNSPNMTLGTVTIKNDPRILPFGHILRKTKINELPQLFNILKGDMSIVGPRPLTKNNFEFYKPYTQKIITTVRPGLSGIGSIIFRGEEDLVPETKSKVFYKDVIAPYKSKLEVWYVRNKNLTVYFKIIYITILIVIHPNLRLKASFFGDIPKPSNELGKKINIKFD